MAGTYDEYLGGLGYNIVERFRGSCHVFKALKDSREAVLKLAYNFLTSEEVQMENEVLERTSGVPGIAKVIGFSQSPEYSKVDISYGKREFLKTTSFFKQKTYTVPTTLIKEYVPEASEPRLTDRMKSEFLDTIRSIHSEGYANLEIIPYKRNKWTDLSRNVVVGENRIWPIDLGSAISLDSGIYKTTWERKRDQDLRDAETLFDHLEENL